MKLLDAIDTTGGHLLLCISAMVLFAALQAAGHAWAHDCLMQAQGALYLAMQLKKA